ncbi:MAG: RlpA-like double-psi beta-barrel domain-containing protein [Solirubrobacterales bacterium]|nr:RlpA-like double-psi beta-barrel domain-containing protein [Solirubrobacterales bacterium]
MTALVVAGCGSSTITHPRRAKRDPVAPPAAVPQPRPQVVEPVAGQASGARSSARRDRPPSAAAAPSSDPPPAAALASDDSPPTAPASVTYAPAKGAPTDAEVRAAIARFRLAIARYHLDRLNLSSALLDPSQVPSGQYNLSIASVYTDYGDPIACGGILHVSTLGVANKTLPCGTQVIFRYGGRAIRVPVIDRGPYIAGRDWDLTGAAAEALRFPGLGEIEWRLG